MPVGMAGRLVYRPRQVAAPALAPGHAMHRISGSASFLVRSRRQGRDMATSTGTADSGTLATDDGVRRRDFINIAAVSAAGVGGLVTLVPLISQMAPSKDVLAESTTELDISAIEAGQAVKAMFRKQPLFVRNLTA